MAHTPEPDIYGIVTKRRQDRMSYAKFIERRLVDRMATPSIRRVINRMIDERLNREIDRIVAERSARTTAEMEALQLPTGPTVGEILLAISEATGVTVGELLGPRRMQRIACARQIAYHMIRTLRADLSLPGIGRVIGNRDHTTVMDGLRKFQRKQGNEPMLTWLAHPAIKQLLSP